MTTHLSTRLVWHDRAWDGHVCDHPGRNAYCVVQQHIRDSLSDPVKLQREVAAAGLPLADLDGWQPPCSRDPDGVLGAWLHDHAQRPSRIPATALRSRRTSRRIPSARPRTAGCARRTSASSARTRSLDIRESDQPGKESGWVFEPDRQIELLRKFWGKLEKEKSLVFFYCNHGNPLDESLSRILLGVSRISRIGPQLYFGTKPPKFPDQYPIWSRCVTHDFENQGFRLPYHEYLKGGHDPKNILCLVPEGAMLDFSYVAEHVSDDVAVGALERLIQSVQAVKDENKVAGEWDRHLRLAQRRSVGSLAEPWAVPRHRQRPPVPRLRVRHGLPASGPDAAARPGARTPGSTSPADP